MSAVAATNAADVAPRMLRPEPSTKEQTIERIKALYPAALDVRFKGTSLVIEWARLDHGDRPR